MAPGMVSLSDQHYEPFAPVGAQNLSHGSEMSTVSLASDIVLSRAHVIIESLDPILCTEDSTSGRILQGGFRKVAPRPNVVTKKESRSVMVFATRFGKKILAFSNSIASSLSSAQAINNPIYLDFEPDWSGRERRRLHARLQLMSEMLAVLVGTLSRACGKYNFDDNPSMNTAGRRKGETPEMGFLGLAPADNLAATYDPAEQVLKLFARGEAPNFTYGFEFKRLTWLGGLKFELLAWSGPHASGARKYDYSQSFNIANLKVVDPDGSVNIVTCNHQNGQNVPVQWLGFEPVNTTLDPFVASSPKSSDQSAMVGTPQTFDAEVVTINALFREKFTIQESTHTSQSGSVQVQYSPFALTLQYAAIEFENLVWTFNSIETGRTQVIVNISPAFGGSSIRKVYDINVIVLENSLIAGDALSGTAKGPLRAILDFAGRVKVALAIVQRTAPEAQLLVVEATLPRGVVYPVKDPLRLSQLECVFRTNSGTAIIRSTGWGEYGLPVFLSYGRIGVSVVNLQDVEVDILPAVDAIRAAGFDLAFWSVTLDHPLVAPGQLHNEPYYIFHMVNGSYIFVGAKDKEVVVNQAGEKMLPSPATAG